MTGPTVGVAYLGILVTLVMFLAVPAIIIAVIYFRHRERMAYLSRLPYPPPGAPGATPQDGDAAPPAGSAAPPRSGYGWDGPQTYPRNPALVHPLARIGTLIGVGAGISVGLLTLGVQPLLLAGLIPLFIGLIRLGELYLGPRAPSPSPSEAAFWLHRALWTGGIGLALLLGFATLGMTPLLLCGTVPIGYALGLLIAYGLSRRIG